MNRPRPPIGEVKKFWNENPLCASAIPYAPGSPEYFEYYDKMRELNESLEFSYRLHEYQSFSKKKVLDVGCGNGYVLSKYAKEGAETHGIDITQAGIELCRRRFEYLDLRCSFEVANAEDLPFDNDTFDCVCSMGVLHHVPDTQKALSEIHRVMKKGARLIVMFYHRNSAWYRIRMPLQGLMENRSREQLVNEVDGVGNPKGDVYSKRELADLLSGFEHIEMVTGLLRNWMVLPRFSRVIPASWLNPFEKRYGWFLYGKAIKG